jgi:stress-induced morphogen
MFHKQGSGDARNTPMVIARSTARKGHTDDCKSYLFAGKYATQHATQHATPTIEPSYHTHTHHANVCATQVQDISGGCGSMYAIAIESAKFKGLSVIKQHKLVNQVLKEEIAGWHGVQLRTKAA